MIVVDTSAIIAILLAEPEADAFDAVLTGPDEVRMSALSVLEAEIVARGRTARDLSSRVRRVLALRGVEIVAFDDAQATLASEAYARFGKGFHSARLNMGDCAAYALAKSLDAPLLFKGDDFARTDIVSALTPG